MKILRISVPGTHNEAANPIAICPVAYATFTTHRYEIAGPDGFDFWFDVVSFGKYKYVLGTIERPLLDGNSTALDDSNDLKKIYCLDQPTPSGVLAYLQYNNPTLWQAVVGHFPAPTEAFYTSNPLGDQDTNEDFEQITMEMEEETTQQLLAMFASKDL
jgi:hypothetical protein